MSSVNLEFLELALVYMIFSACQHVIDFGWAFSKAPCFAQARVDSAARRDPSHNIRPGAFFIGEFIVPASPFGVCYHSGAPRPHYRRSLGVKLPPKNPS